MRPIFPNVAQRPVEELEAIGVRYGTQPPNGVRGATVDDCVSLTALLNVVARKPSSDQGKCGVGLGYAQQCARCSLRRRAQMRSPIRFVAQGRRDLIARFYAWDETLPSPACFLRSSSATLSLLPRRVCRSIHAPNLAKHADAARRRYSYAGSRTITAALRILGRERDPK